MLHPFQTDIFDPSDPDQVKRVRAAWSCHEGFHIGASALEVDGQRWIYLNHPNPYPNPYPKLAGMFAALVYPLPETYGVDPHMAMNAFEREWDTGRKRLWTLDPPPQVQEQAVPQPSTPSALGQDLKSPQRSPRDLHTVVLAGAVPLPGLEPWTAFGRRG